MEREITKNTQTFTLRDNSNGNEYEYPIKEGTRGPSVVDMQTFFKDTGMFTYDPGDSSIRANKFTRVLCTIGTSFGRPHNTKNMICNQNFHFSINFMVLSRDNTLQNTQKQTQK